MMTHPNPLTGQELAALTGRPASDYADALAAFDQDELFDTARAELVASVWDGTSDVNGVAADVVRESLGIPAGGHVAMVTAADGGVLVLQAIEPHRPGLVAMDAERAQQVADETADTRVAEAVRAQVLAGLPADLQPQPGQVAPTAPGGADVSALREQVEQLTATATAQQESIDWLAGVVLDLATGTEVTE